MAKIQYPVLLSREDRTDAEYFRYLYSVYMKHIVGNEIYVFDKMVNMLWNRSIAGIDLLFWHLITGEEDADLSKIDYSRGERLPYIPYVINNCDVSPRDIHWYYQTDNRRSMLVIMSMDQNIRYQCVLEERSHYFQLVTAYPVRKRTFKKRLVEYENYWENRNRPEGRLP